MEQLTLKQKLFLLQNEVGKISKDANNPFFKSKYFDINGLIEHLRPFFEQHRLLLLQPIKNDSVYSEIHDIDSGEFEHSCISLSDIKDPQKRGSEVTYYRRYTLASLLALQATDDDANLASGKIEKERVVTSEEKLNGCKTLQELRSVYMGLPDREQARLISLKDKLKETLK